MACLPSNKKAGVGKSQLPPFQLIVLAARLKVTNRLATVFSAKRKKDLRVDIGINKAVVAVYVQDGNDVTRMVARRAIYMRGTWG